MNDIIFIAEPHIFQFQDSQKGVALHPNFHLLNTNIRGSCQLLAYVNKSLTTNYKFSIDDECIKITIGGARISRVYANPCQTPGHLHNLLNSIKPHPKSCVLGDFNAHH